MKNKNNKMVLLMKDFSIETVSEKTFRESIEIKDVKYILIPILGFQSYSFIYLKPNKYLKFTEVKIQYKIDFQYYKDGKSEYMIQHPLLERTITSIIELYNLLHSFHRYGLINRLEEFYINEILPPDHYVTISKFQIEFFEKDEVTYSFVYDGMPIFPFNILDSIKEIYNTKYKVYQSIYNHTFPYITIHDNIWEMKKENGDLNIHDLIGSFGVITKIITFIDYTEFLALRRSVKGIGIQMSSINIKQYPLLHDLTAEEFHSQLLTMIEPLKTGFLWLSDTNRIIEFIDTLTMSSQLSEVLINEYLDHWIKEEYRDKFEVETYWLLEFDFLSTTSPSGMILINNRNVELGSFLNEIKLIERKL